MKILIPTTIVLALAISRADARDPISKRPTCVVLNFDAGGEADAGDAGMLANMISVKAAGARTFSVIPRYKVNRALAKARFNTTSRSDPAARALTAGRILNVDFVIFGSLSKSIDKNEASAMLLDVRAGKVIDRVAVATSGDPATFRAKAAGEIARKLAGQSTPATSTRAFARIEPEPEAKPVSPAAPASRQPVVHRSTPSRATPYPPPEQPGSLKSPNQAFEPIKPWSEYLREKTAATSQYAKYYWKEFRTASEGRLDAGIRYRKTSLKKERKNSFLGTINAMDLESAGIPAELFATWYFNDYIGAEASWFNIRARTITDPEGFSDGAIRVSGPTFAVTGKYMDYAPWVPFASAGIGMFSVSFDHEDWWRYGYESAAHWESEGRPSYSVTGKIRDLDFEDAVGKFLLVGICYQVDEQWSAELSIRSMWLSAKSQYTIDAPDGVRIRDTTNWPLGNSSWLVGARYSF